MFRFTPLTNQLVKREYHISDVETRTFRDIPLIEYLPKSIQRVEGSHSNGEPSSNSTVFFNNGCNITGKFRSGKPKYCKIFLKNANTNYLGYFKDNLAEGIGYLTIDTMIFEGNFSKGCLKKGKLSFGNGDYFMGNFRNQCPSSPGYFYYKESDTYVDNKGENGGFNNFCFGVEMFWCREPKIKSVKKVSGRNTLFIKFTNGDTFNGQCSGLDMKNCDGQFSYEETPNSDFLSFHGKIINYEPVSSKGIFIHPISLDRYEGNFKEGNYEMIGGPDNIILSKTVEKLEKSLSNVKIKYKDGNELNGTVTIKGDNIEPVNAEGVFYKEGTRYEGIWKKSEAIEVKAVFESGIEGTGDLKSMKMVEEWIFTDPEHPKLCGLKSEGKRDYQYDIYGLYSRDGHKYYVNPISDTMSKGICIKRDGEKFVGFFRKNGPFPFHGVNIS